MSPCPIVQDPIVIVGAGIFGLSTALHLAQRGYKNVTVFDKQPYDETLYSYVKGCDAASADSNKIIRSAYGGQREYQDLTKEALVVWDDWNNEIKAGNLALPSGMTSEDRVWINSGVLSCSDDQELSQFDRATVENMEAAGLGNTQLINNDPDHEKLAESKGVKHALQPFAKPTVGVLDTTGGFAVGDKACRYALHKAKSLGVKFVLHPEAGSLASLEKNHESTVVTGIKTTDGQFHPAVMTVLACGGWTPGLLPALDGICETTAGSVVMLQIPERSTLRSRFSPANFPPFMFNVRKGAEGGLYGFPVDDQGILKIGYRGTRFTNPVSQSDGKERSVPVTRWTSPDKISGIPSKAHEVISKFIEEYLPELEQEGVNISNTRLCWYTESFDNHYVIDRVPGMDGLMCATGGSGHAFKFLPTIGNWVVDIMEGKNLERPAVKAWQWRTLKDGETPVNTIMEGSNGLRVLRKVTLVEAKSGKNSVSV